MACEVDGEDGNENQSLGFVSQKKKRDRIKLLCSYGGKILPRPSDDILKYVGGETRVICLSRKATFSEVMKKFSAIEDGDTVLKYQLISEDLDALVSVRSDEDVKHLLDEYHRQEEQGMAPRLRTFLFPSKPIMIESNNHTMELEQRYLDAINGIVRSSKPSILTSSRRASTSNIVNYNSPMGYSPLVSFSSASTSPKAGSLEHHLMVVHEANKILQVNQFSHPHVMHKVRSSPSLCGNQNPNLNFVHRSHLQGGGYHHQQSQSGHCQISRSLSRNSHRGSCLGTPTPPYMSPGGRSESGSMRNLMDHNKSNQNSGCSSPKHHNQRPNAGGGGYSFNDDPYA